MAQLKFPDWATTDIADIGNGDPNKADPGSVKQAEGWKVEKPLLQTMNWVQNLFGKFIRHNNQIILVPTGFELEAGMRVYVENLPGPATVLLPASPLDGQWVDVRTQDRYSVNPVTVNSNGNNIWAAPITDLNLDIESVVYRFYFVSAAGEGDPGTWFFNLTEDIARGT